jgi:methionine transaminase
MQIQSKLPGIGTTIFTEMSVLANQYNAINLGQGFPDYAMSSSLIEKVHQAMKQGNNQYVHMNGLPLLRAQLATKYNKVYSANINGEKNITITPGGTYAIFTALATVLQPSDEVIVFEPAYDCYIPTIELNGAIAITIPLQHPSYTIDWDLVKTKITSKTRMIMINSPHNPTGAVLTDDDIQQLSAIVNDTNIIIHSDEVYEHLIFDQLQHLSLLRYPTLFARSFLTFSFGKTYDCTGWKLGCSIAPDDLMSEFRKIHQFNAFSCNSAIQVGLANHLSESEDYLQLGNLLQQKRDYFQNAMSSTKFNALPSSGSYFQLYDYSAVSDLPEKEFAVWLTKEYGVTTIPVSSFYKNGMENKVIRFCFAKQENLLDEAVERLMKI